MNNQKVPKIRFKGFSGDWEQRKLGEICNQLTAFIDPQNFPDKQFTEYSMPAYDAYRKPEVVNSSCMNSVRKVIDRPCLLINKLNVRKRRIWNIGNPGKDAVCSAEFIPVYSESSDLSFLDYVVSGNSFTTYLEDCSSGSSNSQKRVTPNIIMNAEIMLPSKQEQQKIGAFFASLDHTIALHQSKLDKLKTIKKSMLENCFPKNGEKVPKFRFLGFTGDWEQRKLAELATFSKGTGYSKSDLKESGTPIILYGRLYTKYETTIKDVDTFAEPKNGSTYSASGEVIVPASGETAEDISIASVVEKPGVLLGGDLNIIHPNYNIDPTFLAISVSNGEPHMDMARRAQGKSVVHLHNEDLAQIELRYPSITEQKKIGKYFNGIDHLITLHQRKLDKLKIIKKSLLESMFV